MKMVKTFRIRLASVLVLAALALTFISPSINTAQAQSNGAVPGQALGLNSDADLWRFIRNGNSGDTQMKDQLASVMIQSEGENWRAVRNGPVSVYGAAGVLGIIVLLAGFYSWRGRITIDAGPSGKTIERFGTIEFALWALHLTAFDWSRSLYCIHYCRQICSQLSFICFYGGACVVFCFVGAS